MIERYFSYYSLKTIDYVHPYHQHVFFNKSLKKNVLIELL